MQKGTRIAALGLIGLAALLLVVAASMGLRKPKPPATTASAPQKGETAVVVAAQELTVGVPLTVSDLKVVPLAAVPPGGYSNPTILIGKVPTTSIAAGTPLTRPLLAEGLALNLQAGERAIAIPVDELAGAGNRVNPGDYVDVFFALKDHNQIGNTREDNSQTRLLLSRLRVLSFGSTDLDQAPTAAETNAAQENKGEAGASADGSTTPSRSARIGRSNTNAQPVAPAHSAVLAVPVEEANKLLLGAQQGKLFLALRNPSDPGRPDASLFPQPKNVLTPRADLTADLRETASLPENSAFAGISGDGLAGRDAAKPAAAKPVAPRRTTPRATGSSLEIIRGGSSSSP